MFKPGDKVRRTGPTLTYIDELAHKRMTKGEIYVVELYYKRSEDIKLVGYKYTYDATRFELVKSPIKSHLPEFL